MNGSGGNNRADLRRVQIGPDDDIEAWLARFLDIKTTFDNYRKEAERLLLWSTRQRQKPSSPLTHEDWLSYKTLLAGPQPASLWVAPEGRKHRRTYPQWRPFAGPLSAASQRQAWGILNALFSWLVNAGYLRPSQ